MLLCVLMVLLNGVSLVKLLDISVFFRRTIIKIREVQGPALVFKAHPYSFTNSEWSQFSSQECTMLNASSRV
ncbi:hypothetical protein HW555_008193 [Spodoptera exigua]|uniref:Uncharacterized protein n=1 Tax=Spodoptera exigua TaxID=7107 RepID=A0A835G3E0_SPOEX|nr:hypothetical protein HW555_013225 [Spodoptera exigua]KAF9406404.1 hypothetical protein HW555_013226 [Spodoptera exigua]KAF9406405.1 hypothetical protein HW555_013227 [Spodoptera exigua]KAF9413746.1 hypothetical protein HW555_008192 [Spodoptera exigua]KAF9413747.1 hypothetical protein HW555_008193 [Spodoptera exigua]